MGGKPDKASLGLLGRLGFLPLLAAVLGKTFFATLTGVLVKQKDRPRTYYKWVVYSAFRTMISLQSSAQEQFSQPNTNQVYNDFCKKKKLTPCSESLADGTKAHWIGSKDATTVFLYFHGGGYNASMHPNHADFLYEYCESINGRDSNASSQLPSLAALILAYDVAPYATYPRQLAQAAQMLNHLLITLGRSPSNVILGGDSAGAHLVIDVLAHILHPHPDRAVPEVKLSERQKLCAALLVSPWVEMSTHADSYKRNAWKDAVSTSGLQRWASIFLGGAPRDYYNAPLTAPRKWWSELSEIVEKLYVVSGTDEILIDDIRKWQDIVTEEWSGEQERLRFDECQDEAHDTILLDRIFGYPVADIKMYEVYQKYLDEVMPA